MKNEKLNRGIFKKSPEELQQYLHFRRRGSKVENKKKYNRQKEKRRTED